MTINGPLKLSLKLTVSGGGMIFSFFVGGDTSLFSLLDLFRVLEPSGIGLVEGTLDLIVKRMTRG